MTFMAGILKQAALPERLKPAMTNGSRQATESKDGHQGDNPGIQVAFHAWACGLGW